MGAVLCAVSGEQRCLLTISSCRRQGRNLILDCGLGSSEQADQLVGGALFIHPEMRPPLPAGEFYLDQILGLEVVTTAGEALGPVVEILETPAHNVYVTPLASIPAHRDFIEEVDLPGRRLLVRDSACILRNS